MKTYDTGKRCGIARWHRAPLVSRSWRKPRWGPCGGRVLVQKTGRGEFRWEAYCDTCGTCDVDGHRTLREALKTTFFEREEGSPHEGR